MKNFFNAIAGLVLFIFINGSCVHDPIVKPTPDPQDTTKNPIDTTKKDTTTAKHLCDPDTVYFEKDLLPIFQASCAYSGCHDAVSPERGINLTNYDKVISTGRPVAGKSSSSKLYTQVKYNKMPPGAPLDADKVELLRKWIDQGAKNLKCDN